jgi:hypothetical protein
VRRIGVQDGQGKKELGAFPKLRGDPQTSSMALDDFAADGQTHAGSRDLSPMETLEEAEDVLVILWRDSDAVVAHAEDSLVLVFSARTRTCGGASERYLMALLTRF